MSDVGVDDYEAQRALTERLTGDEMVQRVARAIGDQQAYGKVEYKRRVGYQGRLSIARAVLDAVCEGLGIPTSIDLMMDPSPASVPSERVDQ